MCSVKPTTTSLVNQFLGQTMKLLASKYVSYLVKLCIIPVSFNEDEIQFKWFSWKTLVHIIFNFVLTITFSMIQWCLDPNLVNKVGRTGGENTTIGKINMILWSGTFMFSLLFPIILAKGLNNANADLIRNERMCWPKKFWKVLIGLNIFLLQKTFVDKTYFRCVT